MTTMTPDEFAILQRMHDAGGLRAPDPAQFTIVQPAAAAAAPAAEAPHAEAPPATTEPVWGTAAFDAVPAEYRDAVKAGAAAHVGRLALEHAANQLLAKPDDVHRFITDPAQFVTKEGVIDRDAIREAVTKLANERPELSVHRALGPLTAAPGFGAGGAPDTTANTTASVLAHMQDHAGIKPT